MKKTNEYEVKLELFEGPLDLLLFLVAKTEVDIVDISVAKIARQYLDYLDIIRDLNINVASEYLLMAATLIRLKSQELMPDSQKDEIEEEDGIVNRQQLIEKLLEYKKYKEAASSLKIYETENFGSYGRGTHEQPDNNIQEKELSLDSLNVFDLITAFKRVLERSQEETENLHVLQREDVRLDDRLEHVLCAIEDNDEVLFDDLFKDDMRKIVLVVTFMAILELVKMGKIAFRQEKQLGNLFVKKAAKNKKTTPDNLEKEE